MKSMIHRSTIRRAFIAICLVSQVSTLDTKVESSDIASGKLMETQALLWKIELLEHQMNEKLLKVNDEMKQLKTILLEQQQHLRSTLFEQQQQLAQQQRNVNQQLSAMQEQLNQQRIATALIENNCVKRDNFSTENLALYRNAIQSSTWLNTEIKLAQIASFAVDGLSSPCSHTEAIAPVWWAVDLGEVTTVGRVRITSRPDVFANRLQSFFIGLTNVSPWTTQPPSLNRSSICKYYTGSPPAGIPIDIFCEPNTAPGRYLYVMMMRNEYLTICELEAYSK
jgi:hypothetical protein